MYFNHTISLHNNARTQSLRTEIDQLTRMCSQRQPRKIRKKTVQKQFSNEMKIHFFIEDTHLPKKISKRISSHLITRTANEKPR
jgi:hypothetical protein